MIGRRLALVLLLVSAVAFADDAVWIPDAGLRAAVAGALGVDAEAPIPVQQMLQLRELRARSSAVADLTGLEAARNLAELDLRENPDIINLEPLRGLTQLHYLNLNLNNGIRSIRPLSELSELNVLLLRGVRVLHRPEERAVLVRLGPLDRLNVRDTGLTSVAALLPGLDAGGYREQLDLREN
ncbi:MAG: hypothetical protein EA424_24225, partial [Planctomycetaceae bacterium]